MVDPCVASKTEDNTLTQDPPKSPLASLDAAQDVGTLRHEMSKLVKSRGFHGFDLFSLKTNLIEGYLDPQNFFICDYGLNLISPYFSDDWILTDPCLKEIGKRIAPFDYIAFLHDQPPSGSVKWQKLTMAALNVKRAWSIPLNVPGSLQGATIYMRGDKPGSEELFYSGLNDLYLAAARCMERALTLHIPDTGIPARKPKRDLSPREVDCLRWVAQGKTNWEIATILDISENTVRFHLKNAFRKLDASTRGAAVKAFQERQPPG